MCEDVFAAISCTYHALTHAERGIADYVLAHSQDILSISIVELAQACGISNSTLFRFCRHLGYKGYREFHTALIITLHNHNMLRGPSDGDIREPNACFAGTIRRTYLSMAYVLRQTYAALDPAVMRQAVQSLMAARRIVVIGAEESLAVALRACMELLRCVPCTFCPRDLRARQLITASLTADEALVVFCTEDADALLLDMIEKAHRKGVYILAFSRFPHSPFRTVASHMLVYEHSLDTWMQGPSRLVSGVFLAAVLSSLYAQLAHEAFLSPEQETPL